MFRLIILAIMLLATAAGADPSTYIASWSGQACTAAVSLAIESTATTGFKLVSWCVTTSNATAAATVGVTVRRTTAASTGGTTLTAEGTGASAVSKLSPDADNFAGIARGTGTLTNGATLDQVSLVAAAGFTGTGAPAPYCRSYQDLSKNGQLPSAPAGVANGLAIVVTSAGAGAGSACSITATFEQ